MPGRMRTTIAWLTVAGALVGACTPASAASPGTITVSGIGGRAALVQFTRNLTVISPVLDRMGGPRTGQLSTAYFGFVISRQSDGHVIGGRVRSGFIERDLGLAADVALGPPTIVLPPGSYRITLIGKGATRVVLRTRDLARSVSYRASSPTQIRFEAGPLAASGALPVLEHRSQIHLSRSTFLSYGSAYRDGASGVSYVGECLTSPGAPTCVGGDPQPLGSSSQGLGGSGGGSSGVQAQPGQKHAGTYEVLTQAIPAVDGARYAYTLLTIDPT